MCQEKTNVAVAEDQSSDKLLDFVALRALVQGRGGHIQIFAYEGGRRSVGIHALTSIRCFYCGQYIFRGKGGEHKLAVSDPQAKVLVCHCPNCLLKQILHAPSGDAGQVVKSGETATPTTTNDVAVVCVTDSSVSGMQMLPTSFGGTSLVGAFTKKKSPTGKHLRRDKVGGETSFRQGHHRRHQRGCSFAGTR